MRIGPSPSCLASSSAHTVLVATLPAVFWTAALLVFARGLAYGTPGQIERIPSARQPDRRAWSAARITEDLIGGRGIDEERPYNAEPNTVPPVSALSTTGPRNSLLPDAKTALAAITAKISEPPTPPTTRPCL
jgi:hypothetical protein